MIGPKQLHLNLDHSLGQEDLRETKVFSKETMKNHFLNDFQPYFEESPLITSSSSTTRWTVNWKHLGGQGSRIY